jgi:hypothetical protein
LRSSYGRRVSFVIVPWAFLVSGSLQNFRAAASQW